MRMILLAIAAAFAAAPAMAADKDDVMAKVHQFVDGFNTGDIDGALAACAASAFIIDEFPPYQWTGENACAVWADAYVADAEKNAITDGVVTLAAPKHVDVDGAHAYVVANADYAFKRAGKPTGEKASTFTFALEKQAAGWRITAWTWSKN